VLYSDLGIAIFAHGGSLYEGTGESKSCPGRVKRKIVKSLAPKLVKVVHEECKEVRLGTKVETNGMDSTH